GRPRGRAPGAGERRAAPRSRPRRGDARAGGAAAGPLRLAGGPAPRRLPPPGRRGGGVWRRGGARGLAGPRTLLVPAHAVGPRLLLPGRRATRHAVRHPAAVHL